MTSGQSLYPALFIDRSSALSLFLFLFLSSSDLFLSISLVEPRCNRSPLVAMSSHTKNRAKRRKKSVLTADCRKDPEDEFHCEGCGYRVTTTKSQAWEKRRVSELISFASTVTSSHRSSVSHSACVSTWTVAGHSLSLVRTVEDQTTEFVLVSCSSWVSKLNCLDRLRTSNNISESITQHYN